MLRRTLVATTAVLSVAVFLAVASTATAGRADRPHPQRVELTIAGGDHLDAGNVALAPGVPVRMTVINYTHEFHTFTVSALGISKLILPASGTTPRRTTFTFTPRKPGWFVWHCLICPSGTHGKPHDMSGMLYMIISPTAVS